MKLPFIQAGEIVSTHGVRGEVKVLPWSDGAEFLTNFHRVRIDAITYQIEKCRVQNTCDLLKLSGVDTMEAAEKLRGKAVEIFREDVPEGTVFAAELIGMTVFSGDKTVGTLTDVLDYPGNKVYVVSGDQEYLIPAVKEFVLSIDLENNWMQVHLLEGMGSLEN